MREKERERASGGMQLDEKGSERSAGMKLGARLLEKREKRGTYDSH